VAGGSRCPWRRRPVRRSLQSGRSRRRSSGSAREDPGCGSRHGPHRSDGRPNGRGTARR
jgi:hypothetical protein